MKIGTKPRYPSARTLGLAVETLTRAIPTERTLALSWRTSETGTPNLRVSGRTGDIAWYVDVYHGRFYRAVAADPGGQVWRNLPSLVAYLRRQLALGPLPTTEPMEQP